MTSQTQLCTFVVGGLLFGVDVRQVQEVLRYQEITRVPLAAPVVQGLINLRGQIVTAIDLRRRLELSERPADQTPMNVVVTMPAGPVSFLVDAIGDVLSVDAAAFEPPPSTLRGVARELITGTYKLPKRLLLVLDPAKVLA